jgi:hypothetical protein
MAQPQGLNVPAILTTGIVGTILTMVIVEGVRAYYNHYAYEETARKWEMVRHRTADQLKIEQQQHLSAAGTSIPIRDAMAQIVASGGKLPATQPTK